MKRFIKEKHIRLVLSMLALLAGNSSLWSVKTTRLEDIRIRDPFILTDTTDGKYYMYRTSDSIATAGKVIGGVEVFQSKDLKNWEGPRLVMRIPDDNGLTGTVWAPEVHKYNDKYYLFATINSDIKWKKSLNGWPELTARGTQTVLLVRREQKFLS